MSKQVGLWIDHYKAVIVMMQDEVEVIRELNSNLEKHAWPAASKGAKKPAKPQKGSTPPVPDQKLADHLEGYYKGVISLVKDASSIWVFGPGDAKNELSVLLKNAGLESRLVAIESVEKMSDMKIAAKVRDHYLR